jgi:CelD/BcsL family acetyltransferase involved in cellulose biosynthesis
MLDEGNLHLTFLTVKGQAIAYNLGYLGESTYYYLKTSYDEAFRAQSPGTVLRAWLIRDLIADGIEIFDFPGEPYEWEAQWTQELRWHRSLLLYNNTIRARLLSYLERLNNLKRKKKMEKKVVFQNPFEIQAPRAYSR